MENKRNAPLLRIFNLFIVSIIAALFYTFLTFFEPNQPQTIQLSFVEKFFWIPLFNIAYFIPFVFIIGIPSTILNTVIKKKMNIGAVIFDIFFYVIVSFLVLLILPGMIRETSAQTNYTFFVNPYYLIPFISSTILILLENRKKSGI